MEDSSHNFPFLDAETYKWIFVGGKGGVGKTTTSCTIATTLALRGKRVCIVSTDPASNIGDAFQQHFSSEPQPVNGIQNLWAMDSVNKSEAHDLPQIASIPGIDELKALSSLFSSIEKNEFDVVVFDTAPTGHTMKLLGLPEMAGSMLDGGIGQLLGESGANMFSNLFSTLSSTLGSNAGPKLDMLKSLLSRAAQRLKNPSECTFVCVLLPEFLPLYETERLITFLDEIEIESHVLVINQILDNNEAQHCKFCKKRSDMQQRYLSQIHSMYGDDFNILEIPMQEDEIKGSPAIVKFTEKFSSLFTPVSK